MDEISQLQKLAGINSFQGYTPYTIEDGSNISITGNEKAVIQREQDIVLAALEEFPRRQNHVFIIRNVDLNQGH